MDVDEFLDRELVDLGLEPDNDEKEVRRKPSGSVGAQLGLKDIKTRGNASLEDAEQTYMSLWSLLAQNRLKWDKELYDQVYSMNRNFSSSLIQSYEEAKKKKNMVMDMIARGRNAVKYGKKDIPLKIYAQIQEIVNSIPNIFFEEKKSAQEQVLGYYREITSANDAELISKVYSIAQQVSQLLDSINSAMASSDLASASSNYGKCLELFNQIPGGFLMVKNAAGARLLDVYKKLSIQSEISVLQGHLGNPAQSPIQPYRAFSARVAEPRITQPKAYYKKPPHYAATPKKEIKKDASKETAKQENPQAVLIRKKVESAKRNIKKGFYNEAWKDTDEALQINPKDVESKALRAKIKTLQ